MRVSALRATGLQICLCESLRSLCDLCGYMVCFYRKERKGMQGQSRKLTQYPLTIVAADLTISMQKLSKRQIPDSKVGEE
jgi:hypothetical protein